jgi:hypothetical protein
VLWSTVPNDIQVDSSNLYALVGASNAVYVCPKSGCGSTPTTLVTTPSYGPNGVNLLAEDDSTIYFGGWGGIGACAKSGCTAPTMIRTLPFTNMETSPTIVSMVSDGSTIYFTEFDTAWGSLESCPVTGCNGSPTMIGSNAGYFLTMDNANVYWTALELQSTNEVDESVNATPK